MDRSRVALASVVLLLLHCRGCPPHPPGDQACDPLKATVCAAPSVPVCFDQCATPLPDGARCTPDPCAPDGSCAGGESCTTTGQLDGQYHCFQLGLSAGAPCKPLDWRALPCATGLYCEAPECHDNGAPSRCSAGQVIGQSCDSDFEKPRCFACEPGAHCVGGTCLKPCTASAPLKCPCNTRCGTTATSLSPPVNSHLCYRCKQLQDTGCGPAEPCCDGSTCVAVPIGTAVSSKCCRPHGQRCSVSGDCCPQSGDSCLDDICTCRVEGAGCVNGSSQCCLGLVCAGGACRKPSPVCGRTVDCQPAPGVPVVCGETTCTGGVTTCRAKSPPPAGCPGAPRPGPPPGTCIAEGSGDCASVADCCPRPGMYCAASGSTAPSLCLCPHAGDPCSPTHGCCGDLEPGTGRRLLCGTQAGGTTAGVCTFDCGDATQPPRTAGKEHSCSGDRSCCIGYFCGGPDISNGCIPPP